MSGFNRMMARKLELTHEVRSPNSKSPGGVKVTLRKHKRGDPWWRGKIADVIEARHAKG